MEYRIYRSRRKSIILLLGCSVFVAIPFAIAILKGKNPPLSLWLSAAFFGLGVLIGLWGLFDRKPWIIVDAEGIWDRSLIKQRIPWEMINGAYPFSIGGNAFIGLVLDEEYQAGLKISRLAKTGNKILGVETLNINVSPTGANADMLFTLIATMPRLEQENRETMIEALVFTRGLEKRR